MGSVFLARDTELDRDVAIKVLHPEDAHPQEQTTNRLRQEARAIAALNHPGIITIYEVGSDDDTDFIVMEHRDGAS